MWIAGNRELRRKKSNSKRSKANFSLPQLRNSSEGGEEKNRMVTGEKGTICHSRIQRKVQTVSIGRS